LIPIQSKFTIQNSKLSSDGNHRWIHHWKLPDGKITLSLARAASGYLLRFPDQTDFLISEDGLDIRCHPAANATRDTVEHYYRDQVLPRVLSHQGHTMVHASAVSIDDHAVAFIGETGCGKSTLAAAFGQCGTPMLADDCIQLNLENGHVTATPFDTGARLWPDSLQALFETTPALSPMAYYSSKKRLTSGGKVIDTPLPIKAVFFLEAPDACRNNRQINISPITKQNALMNLIKQSFQLDVTDQQKNTALFNRLADMTQHLATYSLSYPRNYALLPEVQNEIMGWVDRM
jgi:hypothetical protein